MFAVSIAQQRGVSGPGTDDHQWDHTHTSFRGAKKFEEGDQAVRRWLGCDAFLRKMFCQSASHVMNRARVTAF